MLLESILSFYFVGAMLNFFLLDCIIKLFLCNTVVCDNKNMTPDTFVVVLLFKLLRLV